MAGWILLVIFLLSFLNMEMFAGLSIQNYKEENEKNG